MRWQQVYVAGIGTYLPERVPVRPDDHPRWADRLGFRSVLMEPKLAPPEMAVAAATQAIRRSGVAAADITVLLHGSTWFQGLDIWPVASYIADRAVGRYVPAYDVQQRCNVGVSGLELAASYLATFPGAAVFTTADRFDGPGVNRWTLRPGTVYGDGAAAVVLSGRRGFARLVATRTAVDNSLEPLTRGAEEFTAASSATDRDIHLDDRAAEHRGDFDENESTTRLIRLIRKATLGALADAGVGMGDIARVVTPAVRVLDSPIQLHQLIGVPEDKTTWDYCRSTGHLGAGDWIAGLAHLVDDGLVAVGDRVLLYGGGAGYSCTVAVLEIVAEPAA